jgi:hypothetical protein
VRRLTLLLVAGAFAVVLAACGSDDPPVVTAGLDTRTVTVGEVEVTITPTRVDASGAEFDIALDSHSVELDLDIADRATLTIDDQAWTQPTWEGSGSGSHHLEGTLGFTAAGPAAGDAVLSLEGLDEPVAARWALTEGT